MPRLALLLVVSLPLATPLVVAVTNAAGRMGVSVVGQLRERWQTQLADEEKDGKVEPLQIRAVVRSASEADRLKLDLCGAVLRDGKMLAPLLDIKDDLNIDLCVVPDSLEESDGLAAAFDGADIAVLLSAAHADFSVDTDSLQLPVGATALQTGAAFTAQASNSYAALAAAAYMAATSSGVNVRVPLVDGAAAARRLGAEIAAVTRASSMRHVVLRSSMGVCALESTLGSGSADETEAAERLALASTAVTRMGGGATIAAQADAESALRTRCAGCGVDYTVLRLGALLDTAGDVPLAFGQSDDLLLERIADERANEPPLISRNDAARLVVEVVRRGLPTLKGATIDAAWASKWGLSSAGTEEAARTATRQDVVAAMEKARVTA